MTYLGAQLSTSGGDKSGKGDEKSYCYRLDIHDAFDPLALSMLEKNKLHYFITPSTQWMEEEVILRYPIKDELESLEGGRIWKKKDFLDFLAHLVAAGKEAEDYLLVKKDISWTDRLIFLGEKGPRIIYLPVALSNEKAPLDRFLKKIIVEGHFSNENLDFLPDLIAVMGEKDFSLTRLEEFLASYSEDEKNGQKDVLSSPNRLKEDFQAQGDRHAVEKKTVEDKQKNLDNQALFQDYPSPEAFIQKKESVTDKSLNHKEKPSFFQVDRKTDNKQANPAIARPERISFSYLMFHFSLENWKRYRLQKKKKAEELPGKMEKMEGETKLLKGSGAFLWWDRKKRAFPLERAPFVLGSGEEASLQVENPYVSRNHAQILYENGQYLLVDLGSSNGTFLEGKKLDPGEKAVLKDQNHISLAKEEFIFFSA